MNRYAILPLLVLAACGGEAKKTPPATSAPGAAAKSISLRVEGMS